MISVDYKKSEKDEIFELIKNDKFEEFKERYKKFIECNNFDKNESTKYYDKKSKDNFINFALDTGSQNLRIGKTIYETKTNSTFDGAICR